MYQSPITRIVSDVSGCVLKQEEDNAIIEIKQSIEYNIDKRELLKALSYDREEYEAWQRDMEKALDLLLDWVIDCGFGYDNIPEEYDEYREDVKDMSYKDGLKYIVLRESDKK